MNYSYAKDIIERATNLFNSSQDETFREMIGPMINSVKDAICSEANVSSLDEIFSSKALGKELSTNIVSLVTELEISI